MKYTKAMIDVVELEVEEVVMTSTGCSDDCDDTYVCKREI